MRTALHLSLVLFAVALAGCAPKIGDKCKNSGDCSLDGQRICDTAQPGGYCTIQGCDPDTCPGGSVCVEWRFDPPRTAESYCMRTCRADSSCRSGYTCVTTENCALRSLIDCSRLARIIDLETASDTEFCAATGFEDVGDEGMLECAFPPDAGPDGGADAGPGCEP